MIKAELENKVFTTFFKKGDYSCLNKKTTKYFLRENNIKFKYVKAIRNNHVTSYIIKRDHLMKANLNKLCKKYQEKKDIIELSKKYDFPPFNLKRAIEQKLHIKIDTDLNEVDCFTNPETSAKVNKFAEKFEYKIEKILKRKGCQYKTQNDLIKAGITPTPDFLLTEPLIFNGKNIVWIDAKMMFGGNNWFTKSKLKKQNNKYLLNFGEGLFVFRYSYSEVLTIPNGNFCSYKEFKEKLK